jgi:hypothetical protein
MRTITVVEAMSRFAASLAAVVARLVPDRPRVAADAFRDVWSDGDIDLRAPGDPQAEDVGSLDE